jgi:hypothetical protein
MPKSGVGTNPQAALRHHEQERACNAPGCRLTIIASEADDQRRITGTPMAKKPHDVQHRKLDKKLADLRKTLSAHADAIDDLLPIIRRPGWTTPQELAFSLALVESLFAQAAAGYQTQQALLKVAKTIR